MYYNNTKMRVVKKIISVISRTNKPQLFQRALVPKQQASSVGSRITAKPTPVIKKKAVSAPTVTVPRMEDDASFMAFYAYYHPLGCTKPYFVESIDRGQRREWAALKIIDAHVERCGDWSHTLESFCRHGYSLEGVICEKRIVEQLSKPLYEGRFSLPGSVSTKPKMPVGVYFQKSSIYYFKKYESLCRKWDKPEGVKRCQRSIQFLEKQKELEKRQQLEAISRQKVETIKRGMLPNIQNQDYLDRILRDVCCLRDFAYYKQRSWCIPDEDIRKIFGKTSRLWASAAGEYDAVVQSCNSPYQDKREYLSKHSVFSSLKLPRGASDYISREQYCEYEAQLRSAVCAEKAAEERPRHGKSEAMLRLALKHYTNLGVSAKIRVLQKKLAEELEAVIAYDKRIKPGSKTVAYMQEAETLYRSCGEIAKADKLQQRLQQIKRDKEREKAEAKRDKERAKAKEDAMRIKADNYKREEKWLEAARCYLTESFYREAAHCYEKAGEWLKAIEYYEKANRSTEASKCYEKMGDHYKKVGDLPVAAGYYEKAWEFRQAGDTYAESKNWSSAIACYERLKGRDRDLGGMLIRQVREKRLREKELLEQATRAASEARDLCHARERWRSDALYDMNRARKDGNARAYDIASRGYYDNW
jgi:tetratricopeptide (TPR) repeat protein